MTSAHHFLALLSYFRFPVTFYVRYLYSEMSLHSQTLFP